MFPIDSTIQKWISVDSQANTLCPPTEQSPECPWWSCLAYNWHNSLSIDWMLKNKLHLTYDSSAKLLIAPLVHLDSVINIIIVECYRSDFKLAVHFFSFRYRCSVSSVHLLIIFIMSYRFCLLSFTPLAHCHLISVIRLHRAILATAIWANAFCTVQCSLTELTIALRF